MWQVIATAVIATIAAAWAGIHGALSAVLGGTVSLSATVVYAFVVGLGLAKRGPTAAGAGLAAMLVAEACKILVIFLQLWVVLSTYRDIVAAAFFVSFFVTVILASMAFFVRD